MSAAVERLEHYAFMMDPSGLCLLGASAMSFLLAREPNRV